MATALHARLSTYHIPRGTSPPSPHLPIFRPRHLWLHLHHLRVLRSPWPGGRDRKLADRSQDGQPRVVGKKEKSPAALFMYSRLIQGLRLQHKTSGGPTALTAGPRTPGTLLFRHKKYTYLLVLLIYSQRIGQCPVLQTKLSVWFIDFEMVHVHVVAT